MFANLEKNFCRILDKYRTAQIALYTAGWYPEFNVLLEHIDSQNIVGIMDAYTLEGEVFGKKIITFEEAVEKNVSVIIMVAHEEKLGVICKRIANFCVEHNIMLLDLNGQEQEMMHRIKCHHEYYERNVEELEKIVSEMDDIYWEVKDVLVNQKYWEKEAKLEIRKSIVEVLNKAFQIQKRNYLLVHEQDEAFISEKSLNDIGICNYKKIIYYRDKKDIVLSIENKQKTLLIGTYELCENANSEKINIYKVYSSLDMYKLSTYVSVDNQNEGSYGELKKRIFANKMFNSPFALYKTGGRGKIASAYDIGYLFVAPYVTEFMLWFINRLCEDKVDCVLLGARDGYLVEKLCKMYKEVFPEKCLPDISYFLTSRLVASILNIKDTEGIVDFALTPFVGTPEEMLEKRFFLQKKDIKEYAEQGLVEYICEYQEKILKRAEQIQNGYKKYIEKVPVSIKGKVAYFDFVASGTCQLALSKFMDIDMQGYYFYRMDSNSSEKQALPIISFLRNDYSFEVNSLFLECVFTSDKPTLKYFTDEGEPCYCSEKRTDGQIRYSLEMQKGICDYYKTILEYIKNRKEDSGMFKHYEKGTFLECLYKSYTIIDNDEFNNYFANDEFSNRVACVSNMYKY